MPAARLRRAAHEPPPKPRAFNSSLLGTRAEGAPARFIRAEMLAFRRVTEVAF
jgi:hypothetical protein